MSDEQRPIDPTKNVLQLVAASIRRLDDLQAGAEKLTDSKFEAVNKRINDAIERFDSLRSSDREDIRKTATSVETTATTLRAQVESTAKDKDTQFAAFQSEVYKRLSQLEVGQSASGAGSAGEKSGRISQQQLIMMGVGLVLALITVIGAIVAVAYFVRPK